MNHERTFNVDIQDTSGDPETMGEALASSGGMEKKMIKNIVNISEPISSQQPQIRGTVNCHAIIKLRSGMK